MLLVMCVAPSNAQPVPVIKNNQDLQLMVADENTQPTVRIVLPGRPTTDRAIEVIFPEHVTVRKQGAIEAEHLYLFRPGKEGGPPKWQAGASSLQYENDFDGNIHMLARATLERDGVLFHYEFDNRSSVDYDMVLAPTDPRLTSIFHDVRLERTYVHLKDGFEMLASGTPERINMPLGTWLPARYKAQFIWPIPAQLVQHGSDGITYYYKAARVDQPMIVTLSEDRKWVVASFSHTTGNVWSNPELTCQHVDPEKPLMAGRKVVLEVKILIFAGTLDEALRKVLAQRDTLQ
jgi:hypothetical protein